MRQKDFFITNIYSLRNHKILTNFFVVTNTLLGSRVLVTENNGTGYISSQEIMVALD